MSQPHLETKAGMNVVACALHWQLSYETATLPQKPLGKDEAA